MRKVILLILVFSVVSFVGFAKDNHDIESESMKIEGEKLIKEGIQLYSSGKITDALTRIKNGLKFYPESRDGLLYKAIILSNLGMYEKAIPLYKELLKEYPDDIEVIRNHLITLNRANKHLAAISFCEKYLAKGIYANVYDVLGDAYMQVESYIFAETSYMTHRKNYPEDCWVITKLAMAQVALGKKEDALKNLEYVIKNSELDTVKKHAIEMRDEITGVKEKEEKTKGRFEEIKEEEKKKKADFDPKLKKGEKIEIIIEDHEDNEK